MDLSTRYLGLDLPHPFMPGASPMVDDLGTVRRLEDAGASAIVMHSLFEEQLDMEQLATHHHLESSADSSGEALSYFPVPPDLAIGPEEYLRQLSRITEAVDLPVIASLNGTTPGGWLKYTSLLEEAGANALELNVHQVATDGGESAQEIEERILEMVRAVVAQVRIPVAIKLSCFFTALPHFARRLDEAGVHGMVLFNRFYQSDIDIEELEAAPILRLSDSSELLLRLRWIAILSGRVKASLALTGGVHSAIDAIKAVMCGAHAVQLVSVLLRNGPEYLKTLREQVATWLEEHEYESLSQMQGSMNLLHSPDPKAFTRSNYMRILSSWEGFL